MDYRDINDYEMILEIPIINLKKGILSKDNIDITLYRKGNKLNKSLKEK